MELDEFKIMIKQEPAALAGFDQVWAQQVLRNIKNQAIVMKLRRNLRLELLFALVFMVLVLYTAVTSETTFIKVFAALLFGFSLWFVRYVVKLYRKVSYDHVTSVSVKETLHGLIRTMNEFTRLYFQLTLIIIPVLVLLVFFSAYFNRFSFSDSVDLPFPKDRFLAFLGLSAAWFVLMYFATKWYLKKSYGGYLASLKKNLEELEEDE